MREAGSEGVVPTLGRRLGAFLSSDTPSSLSSPKERFRPDVPDAVDLLGVPGTFAHEEREAEVLPAQVLIAWQSGDPDIW